MHFSLHIKNPKTVCGLGFVPKPIGEFTSHYTSPDPLVSSGEPILLGAEMTSSRRLTTGTFTPPTRLNSTVSAVCIGHEWAET